MSYFNLYPFAQSKFPIFVRVLVCASSWAFHVYIILVKSCFINSYAISKKTKIWQNRMPLLHLLFCQSIQKSNKKNLAA
jgi:hypothetical protein